MPHVRTLLPSLLIAILAIVGGAWAQDLGTVIFQPTVQQVFDAANGTNTGRIAADPSSDAIGFTITSSWFSQARVVVETNLPTPFRLIGNYSSSTRGAVDEVVLSTSQRTVFNGRVYSQARVDVTYWLELTGPVAAGTYDVVVTYTLIGANSVTNTIRVVIPPLLACRISGGDTVAFDYGNAPQTYYTALGGTLPPTPAGTTLTSVDVWSAAPYTVSASLTAVAPGPALPAGALRLKGVALGATPAVVASGSDTGAGYAAVVTPADFALAVDGTELPGQYDSIVTYTVTSP